MERWLLCVHASIQKHTDLSVSVAGKLSGQAIARDCSDRGSASPNRFADTLARKYLHFVEIGGQERRSRRRLRNMPPTPKTPKTNYIRPDGPTNRPTDRRSSLCLASDGISRKRRRRPCCHPLCLLFLLLLLLLFLILFSTFWSAMCHREIWEKLISNTC